MEDFNFWWYIIAGVIYFITRLKKKKTEQNPRPESEQNSPPIQPKSFEDLLREITEGRREEEVPTVEPEPLVIETRKPAENRSLEGERRFFADDESREIYEKSIKMAEGADLDFAPSEHFQEKRLFKGASKIADEWSIADEIREGLQNASDAKKAIIYSEILTRKY